MPRPRCHGCLAVAVASLALAAPAACQDSPVGGTTGPASSRPAAWPCRLVLTSDLREFADRAWDHSATFRDQCRKLGAAGAVVIVRSSRETRHARARIDVTGTGSTLARVRVRPGARAVELIAHELEHVLEHVEGVRFLMEARYPGSGVSLSGDAFETRRAIDAGRRVDREVRVATRRVRPDTAARVTPP